MTNPLSMRLTQATAAPTMGADDGVATAATPRDGHSGDFALALQRHSVAADSRRAPRGDMVPTARAPAAQDSDHSDVAPPAKDDASTPPGAALPADAALPAMPTWPTWPTWLPPMATGLAPLVPADAGRPGAQAGAVGAGGAAASGDSSAAAASLGDARSGNAAAAGSLSADATPATRPMTWRRAQAQGAGDDDVQLPIGRDIPRAPLPRSADSDIRRDPGASEPAGGRFGRVPHAIPPGASTIGGEASDPKPAKDPAVPIDDGWVRDNLPPLRTAIDAARGAPAAIGDAVAAGGASDATQPLPVSGAHAEPLAVAGARDAASMAAASQGAGVVSAAAQAARPPQTSGARSDSNSHRAPADRAEAGDALNATGTEPLAARPVDAPALATPAPPALALTVAAAAPHTAPSAVAAPLQAHIAVAVDQPGFAPALGAQLSMMARDGVQQARLQLHPAEMGPIDVKIAIDGSAARVDFHAAVAATREAIEASLPTLAAALRESGLTLSGGGVFQQAPGQPSPQQSPPQATPGHRQAGGGGVRDAVDAGSLAGSGTGRLQPRRGLVDLVA